MVEAEVQPAFSAVVNGTPLKLDGQTKPFADSLETRFNIDLTNLDLVRYLSYLPGQRNFTVTSGRLSSRLTVAYRHPSDTPARLQLSGRAELSDIQLKSNLKAEEYRFINLPAVTVNFNPDGNLLALDSFEKKIKKFDTEGKWITEFEIENIGEPGLFDISSDETFYIFDENRKEIVVTKKFGENNIYTFGKFQIDKPQQLTKTLNYILIYDKVNDKTTFFESLGQFVKESPGYYQTDKFQDFKLSRFALEHPDSEKILAVSVFPWKFFEIKNNLCLLLSEKEMWIAEFVYERR